jgi:hypothetical protein
MLPLYSVQLIMNYSQLLRKQSSVEIAIHGIFLGRLEKIREIEIKVTFPRRVI